MLRSLYTIMSKGEGASFETRTFTTLDGSRDFYAMGIAYLRWDKFSSCSSSVDLLLKAMLWIDYYDNYVVNFSYSI